MKYYSLANSLNSDYQKMTIDIKAEMVNNFLNNVLNRWLDEDLIGENDYNNLKYLK